MGVRFLETYLEKHSDAAVTVNIKDLIRKHRQLTGSTPVIVIDGYSIMSHLYGGLSWLHGGQLLELKHRIEVFINEVKSAGGDLVLFMDGHCADYKIDVWVERGNRNIERLHNVLDSCSLLSANLYETMSVQNKVVNPPHADTTLMLTFKELGCKVFTSDGDGDLAVAEYTLANKCLGLISQDSDFVIYQPPLCYLSAKHLDFKTLQTKQYDPWKLAACLKTDVKNLPLFATLAGNDFVPYDSLKSFHDSIACTWHVPYRMRCSIVFSSIISFIHSISDHKSSESLKAISLSVFKTCDKADLLKDSYNSYILSSHRPKVQKDLSDPWEASLNILQNTPEYSTWEIARNRKMNFGCVLFDYRNQHLPSPPTLLTELRRKMYGLLFADHNPSEPVVEHILYGVNKFELGQVMAILPTVPHPGLYKLLSTPESDYQNERWALFTWIFKANPSLIKTLPEYLWIPTASLRYLMLQLKDKILPWELNGMIASVVRTKKYCLEEIASMPYPSLENRAICLQTLLYKTFSITIKIMALLRVASMSLMNPFYYQDGKLFHTKYYQAKSNMTSTQLCDGDMESHIYFMTIVSILSAADDET